MDKIVCKYKRIPYLHVCTLHVQRVPCMHGDSDGDNNDNNDDDDDDDDDDNNSNNNRIATGDDVGSM